MKQKKTFQRFCKQSLISSRKKMISAVSNFFLVGRFIRLGLSSAETLFLGLLWYNKAVALFITFWCGGTYYLAIWQLQNPSHTRLKVFFGRPHPNKRETVLTDVFFCLSSNHFDFVRSIAKLTDITSLIKFVCWHSFILSLKDVTSFLQ